MMITLVIAFIVVLLVVSALSFLLGVYVGRDMEGAEGPEKVTSGISHILRKSSVQ